jgi:AP-2 complex subunit alpha
MVLYCSIRRRALDLLYGMCDVTNAKEIVEELLQVTNLFRLLLQEGKLNLAVLLLIHLCGSFD